MIWADKIHFKNRKDTELYIYRVCNLFVPSETSVLLQMGFKHITLEMLVIKMYALHVVPLECGKNFRVNKVLTT